VALAPLEQSVRPGLNLPGVAFTRPRVLVALAAAAVAALVLAAYPWGPQGAIAAFLSAALVTIAAFDYRSLTIPNGLVLPATAIVLIAGLAFYPARVPGLALAGLLAAALLLIPNLVNGSWMGMGDVKLALLLGLVLGWAVIGAIVVAFVATLPVSLLALARGGASARKAAIPFGPFLALGAILVMVIPRLAGIGS